MSDLAEADRLRLEGDIAGADLATARQIQASAEDPALAAAAGALAAGRVAEAHGQVRAVLDRRPDDPLALRLFAEIAARAGRHNDAEALLARALAIAPGDAAARFAYALALHQQGKPVETIAQADRLSRAAPGYPLYRQLGATARMRIGDYAAAAEAYRAVLDAHPDLALTWMAYGHTLKTLGRQPEAIAAYREAVRLRAALGEAWWSLANLKTVALSVDDQARMAAELARADLADEDRFHLQFALAKALEDAGRDEDAFRLYAQANALRRRSLPYDAWELTGHVARCKALFSAPFFAARAGSGSPAADPIFIVGLPRSGSTLVEQILASHSQVEGTQELPDLDAIAWRLGGAAARPSEGAYPDILAALSRAEFAALGDEYLARAKVQRKTAAPRFIDKLPNNFAHVALIQLILPNATIVDARRHPAACCFSAFKQHFALGQAFSYDLADLASYYRDYVELMAHVDAVLPGRVCRVIYEALVADPEAQVRRLLAHCGLPFEDGCLRFYENDRAVRTASSEQVRRPIFTEGVDHWRRFEPWLDRLLGGLGPILAAYPEVPEFPGRRDRGNHPGPADPRQHPQALRLRGPGADGACAGGGPDRPDRGPARPVGLGDPRGAFGLAGRDQPDRGAQAAGPAPQPQPRRPSAQPDAHPARRAGADGLRPRGPAGRARRAALHPPARERRGLGRLGPPAAVAAPGKRSPQRWRPSRDCNICRRRPERFAVERRVFGRPPTIRAPTSRHRPPSRP